MGQIEVLSFYRNPPFAHAAGASVFGGSSADRACQEEQNSHAPNSDREPRDSKKRRLCHTFHGLNLFPLCTIQ